MDKRDPSLCKCMRTWWIWPFACGSLFKCLYFACMCTRLCICLCVSLFCVCACSHRGKQAVWGVICFYRGWQLITNPDKHWERGRGGGKGESERERERKRWQTREGERKGMALGRGIGIWIPRSNCRALRILSSQPLYRFGPERKNRAASHLRCLELINPHQYQYTPR